MAVVLIIVLLYLCHYSTGIAPNMLLARLATQKAKPNGQYCVGLAASKDTNKAITEAQIHEFLRVLPVRD